MPEESSGYNNMGMNGEDEWHANVCEAEIYNN